MTPWAERPAEERALLNPAFCSCLLWRAAIGYESVANRPLPFDIAFLVLPMVLHRETRELLPRSQATSLATWITEHPLSQSCIVDRARTLVPFSKDAMMFGGSHQLITLQGGMIAANRNWKKLLDADLRDTTDEVRDCQKRAEFVGKWLAKAGDANTAMAIVGVRP